MTSDDSELSEYEQKVVEKQAQLKKMFGLSCDDFEEAVDLEAERLAELSEVERKQAELHEKRRRGR